VWILTNNKSPLRKGKIQLVNAVDFFKKMKKNMGYEVVYVKMRYPERKGMTEIKAYLQNEGKLICEDCFNKRDN